MKKLAQLIKVNLKITVKKVHKKAPKLAKCDPLEWDALPWDGTETKLQDLTLHPNMSHMLIELFDSVDHIPLQKLMVEVDRGTFVAGKTKQLSKK
jgi:hypothetical protein